MWYHALRLRWRALLDRRRLDRDLEDELRFHLEMKAERAAQAGVDAEEAMRTARLQFGSPMSWKEAIREMWSFGWIEGIVQDLRYAVRSLRNAPGFAAAALLVLALGIGSNTAIFSVVNGVLLRSLPFADSERLVLLWGNVQRQKVERRGNSYPDYVDWKAQSTSFESMAAYNDGTLTLTGVAEPERINAELVSAGYFELLGISPIQGRTIRDDEDRPGKPTLVALIGEGLRSRRFAGDAGVVGKTLLLNNRQYTVIGVLPAWFRGLSDNADLWVPFTSQGSAENLAERGSRGFPAVAKLKSGMTLRGAQVELDGISSRLEAAYPSTNSKRGVEVAPLHSEVVGGLRTPLFVLLGAVGLVLLIACTNVANLLLARSEARRQEIAIRTALGAGRGRVFRQLVTESMLLSTVGAGLGIAFSVWCVQLLTKASPITLPTFVKSNLDWNVAAFAICLSMLTGVLVGLVPALQAGRKDVSDALNDSSARSGSSVSHQRFRSALVVIEVALAMTLLVGAGLLMQSFRNLAVLHPGFEPKGVLTLIAALPRLESSSQTMSISGRQLLQRIRALPSVVSASVASDIPLGPGGGAMFYSAEGAPIHDAQTAPRAYVHRVSPEFFQTIGATFAAGRTFSEQDMEGTPSVVVVTENLTKRFWPGQDPIGKRIKTGGSGSKNPWLLVIGVVREMKYRGLPDNPTADPDVFFPFSDRQRSVSLLIRTELEPSNLTSAVRATVRDVDPSIPIYEIATMSDRVNRSIERSRFAGWMMTIFAVMALLLSSIGLYGVVSYMIRRRTREIGVRVAMGASPGEVILMVVRNSMTLVGIGVVAGVVAALALGQVLQTLLFGVSALDPLTFAVVAVVLSAVALIACYLPARRASRIDPVQALRNA